MDGRRLRSADSRRRIIAAMMELVEAGDPNPAAEAVAARAGVGLRTVFRLFNDMESLCAEMLQPQRVEFVEAFTRHFDEPKGKARIVALFGRLATLYEVRMPIRRAGIIRQYDSPSLRAGMAELDQAVRAFIEGNLPDALSRDPGRVEILNLLMSYDSWMRLRDAQKLSAERTRALLTGAIETLLATLTAP